ncbi:hypothetical protein [Hydrogenimonas cancrithermarum]|uniref:Uncharacterized protein n=1 Tax=Hydrogenimonas cancrithermarum TaxID=2993563 RepID=A0ABM8FMX5_9BACT|nr:hypothetical protein [Hydrogenimonas cancrithermarum]BDY13717.1 hypothetical protein HCR_20290 [Hydrogenimonas cancrithermarum]
MDRRSFISVAAASTLSGPVFFSGCGGGGGSSTLSKLDSSVTALKRKQSGLNTTLGEFNQTAASTVTGTGTTGGLMQRALGALDTSTFFKTRQPEASYLRSVGGKSVWEHYLTYHEIAGQQYNHQFEKMIASLRLIGYKVDKTTATALDSVEIRSIAAMQLRETDTGALDGFNDLVQQLAEGNFSETIVNLLTVSMEVLKNTLELLLDQDKVKGLAYTVLTYLAIDQLLQIVKEKSLNDLNFDDNDNIVISLGKMVIAAISLFGLISLDRLAEGGSAQVSAVSTRDLSAEEEQELVGFLQNVVTQSQLVSVLLAFLTQVMTNVTADTQAKAKRLMEALSADSSYTLSPEDQELVDNLKRRSKIMAVFALALKSLFNLLAQNGFQAVLEESAGFAEGSEAQSFEFLFGSQINPYDETFNSYLHDLIASITTGDESGDVATTITELIDTLSTQAYNFAVTTEGDAFDFTTQTETDAYNFASLMANLSYTFTAQTESDAYDFATHMADLAYGFTMKIEDDAYNFALQGMEWGYLFASRGEEVGIMADRVLWMAVQIGQMADRIGEMSDRIVYTEQLIVYTEMLILDFGLLIYGGMKLIVNLILTGIALILDRKWYKPQTKDQIVTLIGKNTEQMMENMQEYALAVLENQKSLREVTLDALDWILAMEAMQGEDDTNTTDGSTPAA